MEDHSSWADVRILIADREAAMAVTDTQVGEQSLADILELLNFT